MLIANPTFHFKYYQSSLNYYYSILITLKEFINCLPLIFSCLLLCFNFYLNLFFSNPTFECSQYSSF